MFKTLVVTAALSLCSSAFAQVDVNSTRTMPSVPKNSTLTVTASITIPANQRLADMGGFRDKNGYVGCITNLRPKSIDRVLNQGEVYKVKKVIVGADGVNLVINSKIISEITCYYYPDNMKYRMPTVGEFNEIFSGILNLELATKSSR